MRSDCHDAAKKLYPPKAYGMIKNSRYQQPLKATTYHTGETVSELHYNDGIEDKPYGVPKGL